MRSVQSESNNRIYPRIFHEPYDIRDSNSAWSCLDSIRFLYLIDVTKIETMDCCPVT